MSNGRAHYERRVSQAAAARKPAPKVNRRRCTCEAWNHAVEDEFGVHLVHSESCDFYY